jgi:hypothetical protein
MQRSKQQALMFLLGAVLVGGVLGFSADRVMTAKKPGKRPSARVQMYNDIGIDTLQRAHLDSVLDETNCKIGDIMRPHRPAMDSVRAEGLKTFLGMLTPQQRQAYDEREKRIKAEMEAREREREADWARNNPGKERARRSCPARPNSGGQTTAPNGGTAAPAPERRGPLGPLFY